MALGLDLELGAGGVGGLAGKPNGTVSVDPAVAEGAESGAPAGAGGAAETVALPWTGGRDGALFFSNDQMRDHHWMMLDDMKGRYFQKWRASHQVHYTFKWSHGTNQMGVLDPPSFSYRAQRTLPAAESCPLESASATAVGFHFPSTDDDTWLTAVPELARS